KYRASRSMPAFGAPPVALVGEQDLLDPLGMIENIGSNNWVIAGSKTKSGKPIMANDPHRSIQNPSLRYMAHLNAPGWNVIGAGEPVLPGISIGHNDHGAWGLTIFQIDQEDLYVYETNPDNPDQYRYQGDWREMEIETDVIKVRGAENVPITLKYSIHGPILFEDTEQHLAYGLRAVWLEQGAAPYLASLRMNQATSWPEFRRACEYSGLPGENMVWADRDGNIGWQAVGYTPVRFGWDGRLPVPGNGDYEWQGTVPIKAMPHITNPERGWFGTANNNNVPKSYPNIFADFYSDPARIHRLTEVLNAAISHTIEDSMALQYDNKSMTAQQVTPFITALDVPRDLRGIIALLKRWDFVMDRKSAAALVYDKWELAMLERLNEAVLPGQQGRGIVTRVKLLEWVLSPPAFVFGDKPTRERDLMMLVSLRTAVDLLSEQFGDDYTKWRYGDVHVAQITHPLSHLVGDAQIRPLVLGPQVLEPLPRGGASNTLNANHGDTRQLSGASFRIIVDTVDWDSAVGTNTPGQSGDPRSPFYNNLFKGWNEGNYFPLYFSRDRIEEVAEGSIRLEPR
ncbi:MAG: penicillin acylase family protein, partial [Pseudomonadales bacterium]